MSFLTSRYSASVAGQAKIVSVQALRAVAAIGVLIRHAGVQQPLCLASGVDLFFVISGFIMVSACWPEFGQEGAPRRFAVRRLWRIVPLYWLATILMTMVVGFDQHLLPEMTKVFKSLFFYPFSKDVPLLPAGWTLNFEMAFYCIFGLVLIMRPRPAVMVASAVLISMVLLGWVFGPVSHNNVAFPLSLEFVFGMVIGVAYCEGARLPKPLSAMAIAFGFIVMGIAPAMGWVSGTGDPLRVLAWGVPAAIIVAGATLRQWKWRPLLSGPTVLLGDASYALYVFHQPLVLILFGLGYGATSWPLVATICVLTSVAIHLLVERPIMTWSRWRSDELKPALVTPSGARS